MWCRVSQSWRGGAFLGVPIVRTVSDWSPEWAPYLRKLPCWVQSRSGKDMKMVMSFKVWDLCGLRCLLEGLGRGSELFGIVSPILAEVRVTS